MSIFKFLLPNQRKSAKVARERLQIVLSHQRMEGSNPDFLAKMRNELLTVISKYVKIDKDQISVQLQRTGSCSVLELNIMLPTEAEEEVLNTED